MKKIVKWITEEELKGIYTSEYWNDIEEEKKKEWWIEDGNYERCLKYLNKSLMGEYKKSENFICNFDGDNIKIADLAAGIGWTSVLISKIKKVKEVHSVEISKHRIGALFENSVKMLSGESDKIFRYLGSFYDLKFEDNSLDIIYMSQAFHHADAPLRLLYECDRVLKNNGRVILVGESYIPIKRILRRFLFNIVRTKTIRFNFYELFPPDQVLGDHYYRVSDYMFMFHSLGYSLDYVRLDTGNVIYIADKLK
jgi:SAM-dependent methyltransferase